MKITDIKQQEKLKGRYSIFVDEKYAFSLSDTALLDAKLTVGQGLAQDELVAYKQMSTDDKLYGQVLRYLAIRSRSRWEIEAYFKRKNVSSETAEKIFTKLQELGLVDDKKFAKSWVENRRLLKPTSKRRLQLELKQKRISQDVIDEVLSEDETDETTVLRGLIVRKRRQTKYQDNEKLMAYLSRQGFNYSDIKDALELEDKE